MLAIPTLVSNDARSTIERQLVGGFEYHDMSDILPINFSLSDAARRRLEELEDSFNERYPDDPAAILGFGWGYMLGTSPDKGNVAIGFHRQSEKRAVVAGAQEAFGRQVIFAVSEANHRRFEGKILDLDDQNQLYLRDPGDTDQ